MNIKNKTKILNIKELKPYKNNAKIHTPAQIEQLKNSIAKYDYIQPICVDKNNVIVIGHGRYRAMMEMDSEQDVEVVDLTYISSLEIKKLRILDNKIVSDEYDHGVLTAELNTIYKNLDSEIEKAVHELSLTDKEIKDMLSKDAKEDGYEIPDEIQTDIKQGDLIEIGKHRLLCGDSTDAEHVAKLMNWEKADCCITSPPYNQGNTKGDLFSHRKRVEKLYTNDYDNKTKDEYFQWSINILNVISNFVKEIHSIVWNVSYNAKSRDDYGKIIFSEKNPFSVKETICWNKGCSINIPQVGIYSRQCELVFVMAKSKKYLTNQKFGGCRWNYWETKKVNQLQNHKATFPIEFAEKAINQFTNENNIILEPFAGSGTTIVASHQLQRKCYGMELDPKYCQVIIDRMKKVDPALVIKKNGKIWE